MAARPARAARAMPARSAATHDEEAEEEDVPARKLPAAQTAGETEGETRWDRQMANLERDAVEIQDDLDNNGELEVTPEEEAERSSLITANARKRVSFNDEKKAALHAETVGMTSASARKQYLLAEAEGWDDKKALLEAELGDDLRRIDAINAKGINREERLKELKEAKGMITDARRRILHGDTRSGGSKSTGAGPLQRSGSHHSGSGHISGGCSGGKSLKRLPPTNELRGEGARDTQGAIADLRIQARRVGAALYTRDQIGVGFTKGGDGFGALDGNGGARGGVGDSWREAWADTKAFGGWGNTVIPWTVSAFIKLMRARLLGLGIPPKLLDQVMDKATPPGYIQGTHSLNSILLNKGELTGADWAPEGGADLIKVLSDSGALKASVTNSPVAFDAAVYATRERILKGVHLLQQAMENIPQDEDAIDFRQPLATNILRMVLELSKEIEGLSTSLHKWHSELVAETMKGDHKLTALQAHTRVINTTKQHSMWESRGLPPPPQYGIAFGALSEAARRGSGRDVNELANEVKDLRIKVANLSKQPKGDAGGRGTTEKRKCINCQQEGHLQAQCPNAPICKVCGEEGHKSYEKDKCSGPKKP